MAKLVIIITCICLFNVARTLPVITENKNTDFNLNDLTKKEINEDKKITLDSGETVPSAFVATDIQGQFRQQTIRSGRRKRGIINGSGCPTGQVWKPRPFYCITCEDYERLSGNDCSE